MWRHPITKKQIKILDEDWGISEDEDGGGWIEVLRPIEKTLACGDSGNGAMREWSEIVAIVESGLGLVSTEDTTSMN